MVYFFAPSTLYFLATKVITNDSAFRVFFIVLLHFLIALAVSLFLAIFAFGGGLVRNPDIGILNGTFFGVPLSGTYGVHTMVDHYFLICVISAYYAQSGWANVVERMLASAVILFFIFIMVLSLSREIVLAVIVVCIIYGFRHLTFIKITVIISILSFCIYANLDKLAAIGALWETKIFLTEHAQDMNSLSSWRLDLQHNAVMQLMPYPLTGTGFYGYKLTKEYSDGNDNIANVSTHIYYLTTAWKMGFIGATFQFMFLAGIVKRSIQFSRKAFPKSAKLYSISLWTFLLVLNMLWDALLSPWYYVPICILCRVYG